jgi:NADP-dependent 3-hydroxy acid dehydrogenase YdfG
VKVADRKQKFISAIKDKLIVITGASSGMDEATAVMLVERGANVVLGARGLDRLEALARRRNKRPTLNVQRPTLNGETDS